MNTNVPPMSTALQAHPTPFLPLVGRQGSADLTPWPALPTPVSRSRAPHRAGERAAELAPVQVSWARHQDEVRAAQRLRHQVFVVEMGARVQLPAGTPPGLDADVFDPHCEHLIARLTRDGAQGAEGDVIGTYRVLTPTAARRIGGYYTESEFDLTRLRGLREHMAELGRSCVHPQWRQGGVILSMWAALADFMQANQLQQVVGCASVGMRDGGHEAANLWQQLRTTHLAPIQHQVRARQPLPVEALANGRPATLPALIKGYLRCGAKVLGAPAWDPDFNTADFAMLLQLQDLPARYQRHFLAP